jgi:hypothetical protein
VPPWSRSHFRFGKYDVASRAHPRSDLRVCAGKQASIAGRAGSRAARLTPQHGLDEKNCGFPGISVRSTDVVGRRRAGVETPAGMLWGPSRLGTPCRGVRSGVRPGGHPDHRQGRASPGSPNQEVPTRKDQTGSPGHGRGASRDKDHLACRRRRFQSPVCRDDLACCRYTGDVPPRSCWSCTPAAGIGQSGAPRRYSGLGNAVYCPWDSWNGRTFHVKQNGSGKRRSCATAWCDVIWQTCSFRFWACVL